MEDFADDAAILPSIADDDTEESLLAMNPFNPRLHDIDAYIESIMKDTNIEDYSCSIDEADLRTDTTIEDYFCSIVEDVEAEDTLTALLGSPPPPLPPPPLLLQPPPPPPPVVLPEPSYANINRHKQQHCIRTDPDENIKAKKLAVGVVFRTGHNNVFCLKARTYHDTPTLGRALMKTSHRHTLPIACVFLQLEGINMLRTAFLHITETLLVSSTNKTKCYFNSASGLPGSNEERTFFCKLLSDIDSPMAAVFINTKCNSAPERILLGCNLDVVPKDAQSSVIRYIIRTQANRDGTLDTRYPDDPMTIKKGVEIALEARKRLSIIESQIFKVRKLY